MRIKILIFLLILTVVHAKAMTESKIKDYMKRYVEKKMDAQVLNIDVISNYLIENTEWSVYFLSMKVKIKKGEVTKRPIVPQTVSVNRG